MDGSELHRVKKEKKTKQNISLKNGKKNLWLRIYFDVGVVYMYESHRHDPTDHDLTYGFWVSIHFQTY